MCWGKRGIIGKYILLHYICYTSESPHCTLPSSSCIFSPAAAMFSHIFLYQRATSLWKMAASLLFISPHTEQDREEGGELSARKGKDIYVTEGWNGMKNTRRREKIWLVGHLSEMWGEKTDRRKTGGKGQNEKGKVEREKRNESANSSFPDVLPGGAFYSGSYVSPPFFSLSHFPSFFYSLEN